MVKYGKLLSPIQLTQNVRLKNRMIKAPQATMYWEADGSVSNRALATYEAMAAGGASMVIIGGVAWMQPPAGVIYCCLHEDKYIEGLKKLTDAMHKHDCYVVAQLNHLGPSARATLDGRPPFGPSALTTEELPSPSQHCMPGREISIEEMQEYKIMIIDAAERAKRAGFDGVEIHGANGYYLASFLSGVWNKRTDQYGIQTIENRTRYVAEIIKGARERLGPDFLIGIRLNGQEWGAKGALTIEEAVENAKALEKEGLNYISVNGYGYGPLPFKYCPDYWPYPEPEEHMKPYMEQYTGQGLFIPGAAAIKKAVQIPVIVAGRMNEDLAEEILEQGKADIIALGRTMLADPEFPNKVAEGRVEDIVRCTRCATCEDPLTEPRKCRVNPALGREKELEVILAQRKRKVMVIGGGPAGMEAARVASLRGHEVTLYEKNGELGGRIKLASMIKGSKIEDVMPIYDYLTSQIEKSNVKVKLKSEVTPELVRKEKPDAIIVATSSPYFIPDIPGIDRKKVFTIPGMAKLASVPMKMFGPEKLSSMTEKFFPVGKKIVILGGQIEGIQCAVFMAKRNKEIVVIEESDVIGTGIPLKYKDRIWPWFDQKGVKIMKNTKCTSVEKDGVNVKHADGSSEFIECNSVMVMMPEYQDTTLYDALKPLVPEIYNAGSVLGAENGLLKDALLDGRRVGCRV